MTLFDELEKRIEKWDSYQELLKSKLLFTFELKIKNHYLMKCSELYRLLIKDGWYPTSQNGSHVKMKHDKKTGIIIFPNHGSQEMGKGLEKKIRKDAGLK
jgi:predicted RNA binding protein YcfA (HicA-like mRNA interferase family)